MAATIKKTNRKGMKKLDGLTAADFMTPNPISVNSDTSVRVAAALLTDRGFSGAPVIDRAGRPVGVITRADVMAHDRERVEYVHDSRAEFYLEECGQRLGETGKLEGFQVVDVDRTRVAEVMTPLIYSVKPDAPAQATIEKFVSLGIHRVFVVDDDSILVGVISALDVLRQLVR
jgi:CBS domain-containing protein